MHDRDRLRQIRVLRERLEHLPASAERDWMLGEVRRRAVDIESGSRAVPLRPLVPEANEPEPKPAPKPVPVPRRTRPKPPLAVAAPRLTVAAPSTAPLPEGLLLCLDDDVPVSPEPGRHRTTAPWARGLRG